MANANQNTKEKTMKTRQMTDAERISVDAAWESYLDLQAECQNLAQANVAYAGYKSELDRMNVVSTLAGYRVKN